MLCSVFMPTRKRPDGVHKAVRSLMDTVAEPSYFEVLLRIDDDDDVTISQSLHSLLGANGWRLEFLSGIVGYHERGNEEELKKHHQL